MTSSEYSDRPVVGRVDNCSKRYPAVVALQDANLEIRAGEVRALLGKNGAGKSTLIRMLTGAETPDSGTVHLGDMLLGGTGSARAAQAFDQGVRVVYQELRLVSELSIAENLFLGRWPSRHGVIHSDVMARKAEAALALLGVQLSPEQSVSSLSPAERQLVEIARVLIGNPKIVILDEPTSSLAEAEAQKVLQAVKRVSSQGIAVIYVSHRMNEIREIADTVTIMRDGSIVETVPVEGASTEEIVRLMLGSSIPEEDKIIPAPRGRPIVELQNVSLPPKIKNVSMTLYQGEVLGIAGLLGSGRTELLQIISGIDKPASGRMLVDGEDVTGIRYRGMLAKGFGFTPESRKEAGIVPMLGIDENVVATDFNAVSRYRVLSTSRIVAATLRVIERLQIKASGAHTPISTLSGGNQQKVVIGRWVHAGSRVLLLDEPTRGVDVEAKTQIYRIIRELAAGGCSVIFVSSEVEELPLVCDRVLVLRDRHIAEEMTAPNLDQDRVMAACLSAA